MAEDPVRSAIDAIGRRVQEELEEHLSALTQRHQEELESTRRAAEADAEQQWSARVEAVRSEWTARLESEVGAVRAESERRMVAESMRLRVEAEQAAAESAAESAARVREELDRLLEDERERAASRLASERQQLFSAREQVQRDLQNAHVQIEALRQEVEGLLAARRNAESAAEEGRRVRDDLTRQIEQAEANLAQAESNLAEERRARGDLAQQLERAEAALGEERRTREDLFGRHEQAEADISEARRTREDLARQVEHAEAALADARRAHEDVAGRLQEASSSADAARIAERQGRLASVERLLAGIRSMDAARSLSDVLAALLTAASAEAPRVALFVVNGTELRGWKATGFDADAPTLHVSAADGGLLADVLQRGEPVVTADGAGPAAPDFAALPHECAAIAVPLLVGAQPVAVLYADDASDGVRENPAPWPEAVQILTRHASVNLAHLTAARAADAMRRSLKPQAAAGARAGAPPASEDGNSARRYARLLVSEIKLYNEAAVRLGRQKRDLLARLKPEIERARRLYEQRISSSVDSRGALFHQELVQTLADGDPALLGNPA